MPSKIFYQRHREFLLKKQRDFQENNKEVIKEQARIKYSLSLEEKNKRNEYAKNWYNNLPDDKKNIKREYQKKRYHNMTDEEMQKHKDYQKNYQKMYREKKKKGKLNLTKMQS